MRGITSTFMIAAVCSQFCVLHGQIKKGRLLNPDDISYRGVPGFYEDAGRPSLEWAQASTTNPEELDVPASLDPPEGLRIRWLGTAGYEISDDETTILIDPFVSRPDDFELLRKVGIDTEAVDHYVLSPIERTGLKVILISHAHYDHVEDVPYILSLYPDPQHRPVVVGDPNIQRLIEGYEPGLGIPWISAENGLENTRMITLHFPGDTTSQEVGQFGEFKIRAFRSEHPRYDFLPWGGPSGEIEGKPPYTIFQYKLHDNLSAGYLIQYRNLRLFISESAIIRHPDKVGPVDILIQGIASRRGENTIPEAMADLKPRYVLPTHYDNFFKPLREFHHFDYVIGFPPDFLRSDQARKRLMIDFSRFDEFIDQFDSHLVPKAREPMRDEHATFDPKLRLMKLLYYYSLEQSVSGRE